MLIKNSSAEVCETMELKSSFLQPPSLDNWLAVNNTTSPTLAKVLCRVKGHMVTPAARGTYGVHTQKTKRAAIQAAEALPPNQSQLFSPLGRNISCMLIFTGHAALERERERKKECVGSLSKAGNSPSCRCLLIVRRWSSDTVLLQWKYRLLLEPLSASQSPGTSPGFCIICEWHLLSSVFHEWPIWLSYNLIIVLITEKRQTIGKYEMI